VVGVPDHVVAVLQLLFRELARVALLAGIERLIALCLPGDLIETGDIGGLDHVHQFRRLLVWIEHP
jgi:hypothetical protein